MSKRPNESEDAREAQKRKRAEKDAENDRMENEFYALLAQANPFYPVKTWSDLCSVNIRFLKKEIEQTYYHLGPTDPETEPLLPALVKLNELGCYTTNGQPGLIEDGNQQKAFIEFHVSDHELAARLKVHLAKFPWVQWMYAEKDPKKFESNFPASVKKVDLTNEFHEDVKKWKVYSSHSVKSEFKSTLSNMPNVDALLNKSGFFILNHREYGAHESLEEILLKFFEK
jgi:hypothetical protein